MPVNVAGSVESRLPFVFDAVNATEAVVTRKGNVKIWIYNSGPDIATLYRDGTDAAHSELRPNSAVSFETNQLDARTNGNLARLIVVLLGD